MYIREVVSHFLYLVLSALYICDCFPHPSRFQYRVKILGTWHLTPKTTVLIVLTILTRMSETSDCRHFTNTTSSQLLSAPTDNYKLRVHVLKEDFLMLGFFCSMYERSAHTHLAPTPSSSLPQASTATRFLIRSSFWRANSSAIFTDPWIFPETRNPGNRAKTLGLLSVLWCCKDTTKYFRPAISRSPMISSFRIASTT